MVIYVVPRFTHPRRLVINMIRASNLMASRRKTGSSTWWILENLSLKFKPLKAMGARTLLTYCGHVFTRETSLSPGFSQLSPEELGEIFDRFDVRHDPFLYSVETFPSHFELRAERHVKEDIDATPELESPRLSQKWLYAENCMSSLRTNLLLMMFLRRFQFSLSCV